MIVVDNVKTIRRDEIFYFHAGLFLKAVKIGGTILRATQCTARDLQERIKKTFKRQVFDWLSTVAEMRRRAERAKNLREKPVAWRFPARFHFEHCCLVRTSALCSGRQMRVGFIAANMVVWVLIFIGLKILG
jgi:hypothetical protein